MSWVSRLMNAFRPERTAAGLDEELRFHFEERVDDLVREGMSRRDAERAARLKFGGAIQIRESSQEVKSAAWLESLAADFRFGLRMLADRPRNDRGAMAAQGDRGRRAGADGPRKHPAVVADDNLTVRDRLLASLAGFFSAVALLLAGIGLYGVIHFAAVRRTREIGIRIALGARRGSVMRLMVQETSVPVAAGIVLGMAGGAGLARYLASQLFDVRPTDFWSLAAPVACILLASAAALLPPAIRASGADPVAALKQE